MERIGRETCEDVAGPKDKAEWKARSEAPSRAPGSIRARLGRSPLVLVNRDRAVAHRLGGIAPVVEAEPERLGQLIVNESARRKERRAGGRWPRRRHLGVGSRGASWLGRKAPASRAAPEECSGSRGMSMAAMGKRPLRPAMGRAAGAEGCDLEGQGVPSCAGVAGRPGRLDRGPGRPQRRRRRAATSPPRPTRARAPGAGTRMASSISTPNGSVSASTVIPPVVVSHETYHPCPSPL